MTIKKFYNIATLSTLKDFNNGSAQDAEAEWALSLDGNYSF